MSGVFEDCALEEVRLPSTLWRIEYNAFRGYRRLASIRLPERLEYLGLWCFEGSGLESISIPPMLRTV